MRWKSFVSCVSCDMACFWLEVDWLRLSTKGSCKGGETSPLFFLSSLKAVKLATTVYLNCVLFLPHFSLFFCSHFLFYSVQCSFSTYNPFPFSILPNSFPALSRPPPFSVCYFLPPIPLFLYLSLCPSSPINCLQSSLCLWANAI